jgi:hypothetical protein
MRRAERLLPCLHLGLDGREFHASSAKM